MGAISLAVVLLIIGTGAVAGIIVNNNEKLSNLDAKIQEKNQNRRLDAVSKLEKASNSQSLQNGSVQKKSKHAKKMTFFEFVKNPGEDFKPDLWDLEVSQDAITSPDNSKIFKGKIILRDDKGKVTEQKDTYFFLPNLYIGPSHSLVKPHLSDKGNVVDESPYLIRNGKDKKVYTPFIPLSEVYTGIEMDLLRNSKTSPYLFDPPADDKTLVDFVEIELERDEVEDYVPVNFKDPVQKAEYEAYIAEMKAMDENSKGSARDMIAGYLEKGVKALAKSKGKSGEGLKAFTRSLTSQIVSHGGVGFEPVKVVSSKKVDASMSQVYDISRLVGRTSSYSNMGLYGASGTGQTNTQGQSKASGAYDYYDRINRAYLTNLAYQNATGHGIVEPGDGMAPPPPMDHHHSGL